MRDLAFRRQQEEKKKSKAKKIGHSWYNHEPTPKQIGFIAHSPKACSCYMCGNPRKHWKQKTFQEIKADIALVGQLVESADSKPV